MLLGRLSHPVAGGVRLQIVRRSLNVRVMSKSVDLPYNPGDGYKQLHSGLEILEFFRSVFIVGLLSVEGNVAGE